MIKKYAGRRTASVQRTAPARSPLHPVAPLLGALLLAVLAVIQLSCANSSQPHVVGDREQRQYLHRLWTEMATYTLRDPQGVAVLELYADQLIANGYAALMHRLLVTSVLNDPDNPYNAVILSRLAAYYAEIDDPALAAYYYRQIVINYRDVYYDGESIHFRSLINLVALTHEPDLLAEYYRLLIYRFADQVDVFASYQQMIEQYRRIANWPLLFATYRELIALCERRLDICQQEQARAYIDGVRARLRFIESDRRWTTSDLDLLVGNIKRALRTRSIAQLLNWQAGVNFFSRSWEQDEFDFNSQINFNIGIFLSRSSVSFASELDSSSNAQEAYLRTWGWSHRIPTWYFYFRRIDFPADPEVHGNWEWAGIFFGELL